MVIIDRRKEGSTFYADQIEIYPYRDTLEVFHRAFDYRITVCFFPKSEVYDDVRNTPIVIDAVRMTIERAKQLRAALDKAIDIAENGDSNV